MTFGNVAPLSQIASARDVMELRRYLRIVRRRLLLIVAIVVAALAAGYFITPRGHTYTGTATLYVGSRSTLPEIGSPQAKAKK